MEITTKYTETGEEIEKKIELLREKLKSHQARFNKEPMNWGYVGDLSYINEKLGEIITSLK